MSPDVGVRGNSSSHPDATTTIATVINLLNKTPYKSDHKQTIYILVVYAHKRDGTLSPKKIISDKNLYVDSLKTLNASRWINVQYNLDE